MVASGRLRLIQTLDRPIRITKIKTPVLSSSRTVYFQIRTPSMSVLTGVLRPTIASLVLFLDYVIRVRLACFDTIRLCGDARNVPLIDCRKVKLVFGFSQGHSRFPGIIFFIVCV